MLFASGLQIGGFNATRRKPARASKCAKEASLAHVFACEHQRLGAAVTLVIRQAAAPGTSRRTLTFSILLCSATRSRRSMMLRCAGLANVLALYVVNARLLAGVHADSAHCDIPISPEGIEAGHTIITDGSCTARRHQHLPGCISHVCRICALSHAKETERIPDCYTLDAFYVVSDPKADPDAPGPAMVDFRDLQLDSSPDASSSGVEEPRGTVKALDDVPVLVNVDHSSPENPNTVVSFGGGDTPQQSKVPGPIATLVPPVSDERPTAADTAHVVASLVPPVSDERSPDTKMVWDASDDNEAFAELLSDNSGESLSSSLEGELPAVAFVEEQGSLQHLRG